MVEGVRVCGTPVVFGHNFVAPYLLACLAVWLTCFSAHVAYLVLLSVFWCVQRLLLLLRSFCVSGTRSWCRCPPAILFCFISGALACIVCIVQRAIAIPLRASDPIEAVICACMHAGLQHLLPVASLWTSSVCLDQALRHKHGYRVFLRSCLSSDIRSTPESADMLAGVAR